jgi:prevent-host-death family protein
MTTITISEAREHLAKIGKRIALRGDRVIVTRRGKKLFALVPVEDAEFMERREDESDLRAIRRAKKDKRPSIPWEKVKKDLGL